MSAPATPTSERIHGLDALRGSLMLLGLLLHAALPFTIQEYEGSVSFGDTDRVSGEFDLIVNFIHSFRIQAFFMVSGFFAALLIWKRSATGMLMNRIRRLGIPFAISFVAIWPLSVAAMFFATGTANGIPLERILTVIPELPYLPFRLAHLWFIYYLLILSLGVGALAWIVSKVRTQKLSFPTLPPTLVLVAVGTLVAVTPILHAYMGTATILSPGTLEVKPLHLAYYAIFYVFGIVVYHARYLLSFMARRALLLLALGLVAFGLDHALAASNAVFAAASAWFLMFGVTGTFLRYARHGSRTMRYLADASYWIYLVHLPVIFICVGILWPLPLSGWAIYLITLLATTIFCGITYHYLARNTVIGSVLNGRRYSRSLKEIGQ